MEGSEIWISLRRTLLRLVLISFRRILNSFHALEVGSGAGTRFGAEACQVFHVKQASGANMMPASIEATKAGVWRIEGRAAG